LRNSRRIVHVFRYKKEKIVAEGAVLSFFYFTPATSLVAVPISSKDAHPERAGIAGGQ
jgi:hypothetical protein